MKVPGGGLEYKKSGDARREFFKLTPNGDQSGRGSRIF